MREIRAAKMTPPERFVRGLGSYVDDVRRPGELAMSVVRSLFAHGKLNAIDTDGARSMRGVQAVLTAGDLAVVPTIPIRKSETIQMAGRRQPVIAIDRVRYVGEPIAVIVADTPARAEDAASLVIADIDAMPAVSDLTATDPAPMWDDGRNNLLSEITATFGEIDDDDDAVIVESAFTTSRHTGLPIEPRGLVAEWRNGVLELWGPTKFVQFTRASVADFFGIPTSSVICHRVDVGGMFGVRGELYPEDFLVPWAARVTQRPVRWTERRRDHLISINHAGEQHHRARISVSADGRFLNFRDDVRYDVGAYPRPIGGRVAEIIVETLPGPYRWEGLDLRCRGVATTQTPVGTVRGPAAGETALVRERMIDMAAARIGMDPLDLRRRNLIGPEEIPYRQHLGRDDHDPIFDSGDFPAMLDELCRRERYATWVQEREHRRSQGERVGLGWGVFVTHSALGEEETLELELTPEGRFLLGTTVTDVGQGSDVMASRVLAAALGVSPDRVDVLSGDSRAHDGGQGTFASRTTVFVTNAIVNAVSRLVDEAVARAATMLQTTPEGVVRTAQGFVAGGDELAWKDLAPLRVLGRHVMARPTYGFGAHLAMVRIEASTGDVRLERIAMGYDCGHAIDRRSVIGQLVGATAMGVGAALHEALRFDEEGQPQVSTLMQYIVPNTGDVPQLSAHLFESGPTGHNPVGAKGAGEAGVIGVSAAIANAVADALGEPGAHVVDRLPIRRERLVRNHRA